MPMSALFSTWKLSAMVLAYSQAIPSNAVVLPTSPHLVQNTVHSTDPRITLAPESSCTGILGGCGKRYDPWDLETYTDRDGVRHSYYRTSSWGNHPESTDQRRGISFGFRGTGLQVYGAPYRQLQELGHVPGKQELCLLGGCQDIDAKAIYDATSEAERDSPVLLWSYDGLPDNSYHRLELRLLDTSQGREQTRAMTVHHIIYTSRSLELLPGYQPSDQELIVNTTYYDTNSWVSFSSGRRPRYDPWRKEVVALSSGDQQTFHHTSSWDHDPYGENARTIFFKFQGVALYVYGASSAQLALIANDNYEHAHQEICIDSECEAIDTHQIYLNIEASRAHEPVLLWSHEGYPSAVLRHVQIRLLDKHSPVGHIRRMTLSRFVVNEVKGHSPWTHPIANAKYSNVTISASSRFVRYSPRRDYVNGDRKYPYSPWDAQRYTAPGGELQTYFRTSTWDHDPTSRIRAWRFSFIGHEIRVYGAPREYLVHPAHAKQEACLDGECHPVDIERAYMRVEPDAEREPVLLWSMKDIDVSRLHTLTMQMIESGEEAGSEVKGMTLERLEYIKVEPSIDTFRSSWWWIWILPIVPAIGGILYCIRSRSSGAGSNIRILSTPQQSYDSTGVLCRQSTPVTSPGSPGIREKSYPYTTLAHPTQFNAPPGGRQRFTSLIGITSRTPSTKFHKPLPCPAPHI
ncbi:hypothetical protein FRB94_010803 [Tulasnella sp. JGI-2019a]|nr:hypothetical protein FRB94_010803 [Tulasnella sp. JGI-2019a]